MGGGRSAGHHPSVTAFSTDGHRRPVRPPPTQTKEPPMTGTIAETAATETYDDRRDADLVARANARGRTPVVFIHGLWLLPTSWDRWTEVFDAAGYAPLSPG